LKTAKTSAKDKAKSVGNLGGNRGKTAGLQNKQEAGTKRP